MSMIDRDLGIYFKKQHGLLNLGQNTLPYLPVAHLSITADFQRTAQSSPAANFYSIWKRIKDMKVESR